MAEVTVYSSSTDGRIINNPAGTPSWDTVHDATTGTTLNTSDSSAWGIYAKDFEGVGNDFSIGRSFFYFDLSGIPSGAIISAAELQIYRAAAAGYSADVSAQEGTQADSLVQDDFNNFVGNEFGHSTFADPAGYKTITLNAAGRTFLESKLGSSVAKICCREYAHDYLDVSPGVNEYSAGTTYYTDETGTDKDPKLVITYTVTVVSYETYHEHTAESPDIKATIGNTDSYHSHSAENTWVSGVLMADDAYHEHISESVPFTNPFSFLVNEAYHGQFSESPTLTLITTVNETYHTLESDDGAIVGDIIKVALTLEYLELESTCNVGWSAELTLEKLQVSASTGSRVELELEKFLCFSSVNTGIISNAALSLQNFTLTSEALIGSVSTGELTLEELLMSADMNCQPQSSCELILEAFIIDCFCSQGRRFDGYILRYNRDNYEC